MILIVPALSGLGGILHAESVTLVATSDTTLNKGDPNNNLGGSSTLIVGTTAAGVRNRALLRFDLTGAIPKGATIKSASLSLVDVSGSKTFTWSHFELHKVLVNWSEGTNSGPHGAAASAGEATWNHRFSTNRPWAQPAAGTNGDYSAAPSAVFYMDKGGATNVWKSSAAMVADVQGWLDAPTGNFGWLVCSDAEGASGSARRFGSREDVKGRGPRLEVEYTLRGSKADK